MGKSDGFNIPFSILKNFRAEKIKSGPDHTRKTQVESKTTTELSDEEVFYRAMSGIKRIENNQICPEPADDKHLLDAITGSLRSEDADVVNTLKSIVSGRTRFDIRQTGEYVEGHVISLEPMIIDKLKRGEIAVQGYLDLHGLIATEAKEKVSVFIGNSYALGYRCLMIIHGRGLKSPEGPVLKNHVINWLSSGVLSKYVLAFCSARPCDGGTGAVYILLKARPDKKTRIRRTA